MKRIFAAGAISVVVLLLASCGTKSPDIKVIGNSSGSESTAPGPTPSK